jgi:hypothetical protein
VRPNNQRPYRELPHSVKERRQHSRPALQLLPLFHKNFPQILREISSANSDLFCRHMFHVEHDLVFHVEHSVERGTSFTVSFAALA